MINNIFIILFILIIVLTAKSEAQIHIKIQFDTSNEFTIDEVYKDFYFKNHKMSIGKKRIKFNPGEINQLIYNVNGPSVPVIYLEDRLKYFYVQQAVFEVSEEKTRRLFMRRITFDKIIKNFEIGFTEGIIATEHINPVYYLPYPYVPAYLYKKMSGLNNKYDKDDDFYAEVDMTYETDNIKLYGEILVDEYPSQSGATNPDKRGHLLGCKVPIYNNYFINLEYSNVFAGVYEHRIEENEYTFDGKYLGHSFGADLEEYDLKIGYEDKNKSISFIYRNIKKGTNNRNVKSSVGIDGVLLKELKEIIESYNFYYLIQIKNSNSKYGIEIKNENYLIANKSTFNIKLSCQYLF